MSTDSSKKVLLLSLSGIGNYIMQSPTIAALKQAHPAWHVTVWVAPRGTRTLAEADPNIDEVIEAPIKNSLTGHLITAYKLRITHYDLGIVLSPGQLIKSAAYLMLAGIPRRIGNAYPLLRNPQSSFLLTDTAAEQSGLHDVEQNLRLLKPLGLKELRIANYELQIPPAHKRDADKLLARLSIPNSRVLIGIHAGSAPNLVAKRWPSENFAKVATALIKNHNAHILLFGGPDEEDQKRALQDLILNSLPNQPQADATIPVSIITTPLLTTAALIERCALMLANDSGLMHIAAAVGVPTFAIFGPTDEKETGPRGLQSFIVRAPGTKPVFKTETNFDLGSGPHSTILAVTPDMVLKKLRQHI